jgi:hypothetical protein
VKKIILKSKCWSIINPSISSRKLFYVIICILITALLIDSSLIKIYNFTTSTADASLEYAGFILLVVIFVIAQYIALAFTKSRIEKMKSNLILSPIHKIVTILQYGLSLLLIIIIFEISLASHYDTLILITIMVVSYGLSIITLGILAQRLFSWFKSKFNRSPVVLLYAVSSTIFAISVLFSLMFIVDIMSKVPNVIEYHGHNLLYSNNPDSIAFTAYNGYVITSILSFIMTWITTAIILRHYSKRIGKIKYWVIVSLPLIYFLSQFIALFLNLFSSLLDENPIFFGILFSVIFSLSKSVGGMLFGIAFWTMAIIIKKPIALRDYLIITAIGFILLFVSDQAISLISAPYPPFGLVSVSTVGLASYLILIGLYYSAVSVSSDIDLRKFVFSSTLKELSLLGSIGAAQMEEEVEKRVIDLTERYKADIKEQTAVESSLDEDEIKRYLDEVLNEVRRKSSKT